MLIRPRRNRANAGIRDLVREARLAPEDLVYPMFVQEGDDTETPIASMPGQSRLGVRRLVEAARHAFAVGVRAVALFPAISDDLKDPRATESTNPNGLLQQAVRALKEAEPGLLVITDVALDPYSSDGHDGVVIDGRIDNAASLPVLADMAVAQARAGADLVAPSDMMDGRVEASCATRSRRGKGFRSTSASLAYCGQVRFRLLRIPSGMRWIRRRKQRRQEDLPDGPGERPRSAA